MSQKLDEFRSSLRSKLLNINFCVEDNFLGQLREKAFSTLCLKQEFPDHYINIPLFKVDIFKSPLKNITLSNNGLLIVGGRVKFNNLNSSKASFIDICSQTLEIALFLQSSYLKDFEYGFLSLLNASFADGTYIYISEDIDFTLTISTEDFFKSSFTRLYFVIAPKVTVTINEQILCQDGFLNVHIEFILQNQSKVIFKRDFKKCLGNLYCLCVTRCLKDSSFEIISEGCASRFLWTDYKTFLENDNALFNISSLHTIHDMESVFITSYVFHNALKTNSYQVFKKILEGRSESVFYGHINISEFGSGSDAYQINKDLKLSKESKAFSMPTLKIKNSDVKATHGSILKDINDEDLFYLQSRGVCLKYCYSLLKEAFLNA